MGLWRLVGVVIISSSLSISSNGVGRSRPNRISLSVDSGVDGSFALVIEEANSPP